MILLGLVLGDDPFTAITLLETAPAAGVTSVEAIETLAEARRQAPAVGAILVASLIAAMAGVTGAQTAALIAAAMLCVLGAAALSMKHRMRTHALELIIEGREDVPVAAVEDERRRLLEPGGRRLLARRFENLAEDAASPASWPTVSVLERPIVATVAGDFRQVGSLLRFGEATARGVALARKLLTDGARSPLYRGELDALRRELGRIRFLLASAQAVPTHPTELESETARLDDERSIG